MKDKINKKSQIKCVTSHVKSDMKNMNIDDVILIKMHHTYTKYYNVYKLVNNKVVGFVNSNNIISFIFIVQNETNTLNEISTNFNNKNLLNSDFERFLIQNSNIKYYTNAYNSSGYLREMAGI